MSNNNQYQDLENGDDISKLVNAIEINWNGAELSYLPAQGTQIVNTTGDLLSFYFEKLNKVG